MKRPSQGDYAQAQKLRGIFVLYLWLSVAICVSASVVIVATGQGEDAKWLASGLFAFGMVGAAFARAVPKLRQPRWWHWVLGTVLILPGAIYAYELATRR